MCHSSCLTCSDVLFTSCLSCPTGTNYLNGACFCTTNWSSTCGYNFILERPLQSFDMIFIVILILVMVLYCLKVKLLFSYRIIVGLQSFSLLIYSTQIYLYSENQYALKILVKANGPYMLTYRNQSISLNYAIPSIALFVCFCSAFFLLYYPIKTFRQNYESYGLYIKENAFDFLSNFYYFGSRMMFYYIGIWLMNQSTTISMIIPCCLFALIILIVLIKTLFNFHNNTTDQSICQAQIHLYSILSPASMIGLPMITQSIVYLIVYLAPIALLILIAVLNKNFEIFNTQKVLFYIIELLMPGFAIAFVSVSDPYKNFIITAALFISFMLITIEMSKLYYSGAILERSNKIHPQDGVSVEQNTQTNVKKVIKMTTKKNVSYF